MLFENTSLVNREPQFGRSMIESRNSDTVSSIQTVETLLSRQSLFSNVLLKFRAFGVFLSLMSLI